MAESMRLPALTALFVILARVVTAITCNAENLAFTVSMPLPIVEKSQLLAAALTFSKPFEAPSRFKLFLSLSRVDILVETFRSN